MVAEFFKAFFLGGVPVGAVSYLLIWWALRAEYFERTTEMKALEKEVKKLAKSRSKRKKRRNGNDDEPIKPRYNPVHNKWLAFGGGFYGVVALMTFGIIELGEIRGFFAAFDDNMGKLAQLDVGMLIGFVIDSIMNFVTAIAWPLYWIGELRTGHFWVWFAAAYAGYWLGARAALANWMPWDRHQ